jgi:hypothetical protein
MNTNPEIEIWGAIIKEENVKSIHIGEIRNHLILETSDPFPGYYGNIPNSLRPRSIFLITEKNYEPEFIARVLKRVGSKMQHPCYASFGFMRIANENYSCIRFKNADCFDNIISIQQHLKDEGIRFMKHKNVYGSALIKIQKAFIIKKADENIYEDTVEDDRFYFEYPYTLEWPDFKEISLRVKNNISNNMFDAAQGYFWRRKGIIDVVRIYDPKHSIGRIKEISHLYYKKTNEWLKNNYFKEGPKIEESERFYIA